MGAVGLDKEELQWRQKSLDVSELSMTGCGKVKEK